MHHAAVAGRRGHLRHQAEPAERLPELASMAAATGTSSGCRRCRRRWRRTRRSPGRAGRRSRRRCSARAPAWHRPRRWPCCRCRHRCRAADREQQRRGDQQRQPELAAARFRNPGDRPHQRSVRAALLMRRARPHDLFGATRPNKPDGLNTSTSTRIEKMITSVQAPAIWPPSASIRPMMHAAHHRAGHVADAAQHRGGEGAQAGGEADDEAGEVVVQAEDQPARAGQRRAEEERHHDDLVHLHAHHARRFGILRGGAHRLADPAFLHEQVQRRPSAPAPRPRSAPRAGRAPRRRCANCTGGIGLG